MKKFYPVLVLVLAFSCFQLHSQSFAPLGSYWNYSCDAGFGSCSSNRTIIVTKDTLINGYETKFLNETIKRNFNFPGCPSNITGGPFGVFQIRNDSVFFGNDTSSLEYKYNWNMNIGDTIELLDYSANSRAYFGVVNSIDTTIQMNGTILKTWHFTTTCKTLPGITPAFSENGSLEIIEKIGPVTDYLTFNPILCGMFGLIDWCNLICFSSDSLDYGSSPCIPLILSTGKTINANHLVKVYPNPSYDNLSIKLKGFNHPEELKIYSILGELVYESELNEPNEIIDISFLTPGVYLATITLNGKTAYKKLIKG